jgi:3',5'-nucleoside bisphosphate phosphatase
VSMRIDLHSHSRVSDGTTSPAAVVRRAAEVGLDVIALTDHDTAAGWDEAAAAASSAGIGFVPGVELSTMHEERGVHVLGYLFDPHYPPLAAEVERILSGRDGRLSAIIGRLAEGGVLLTEAEVRREAGDHGVIGRPHVADALVTRGFAKDRPEAFETLLNPGRAGFVVRYAPSTTDMIGLITDAGGAAVIAHPWGRGSRRVLDLDALAGLASAGLVGIEVDHEDHSVRDRATLRSMAVELGLVVTGASDYHGAGKVGHELGCNLTAPDQLDRLLLAAKANAAASGRAVPRVVEPAPLGRSR